MPYKAASACGVRLKMRWIYHSNRAIYHSNTHLQRLHSWCKSIQYVKYLPKNVLHRTQTKTSAVAVVPNSQTFIRCFSGTNFKPAGSDNDHSNTKDDHRKDGLLRYLEYENIHTLKFVSRRPQQNTFESAAALPSLFEQFHDELTNQPSGRPAPDRIGEYYYVTESFHQNSESDNDEGMDPVFTRILRYKSNIRPPTAEKPQSDEKTNARPDTHVEMVLDTSALSQSSHPTQFHLHSFRINPQQTAIAYLFDTVGNEKRTLAIRPLGKSKGLSSTLHYCEMTPNVGSVAWSNDGKGVYYTVCDDTDRPYMVKYHELSGELTDNLIFDSSSKGTQLHLRDTTVYAESNPIRTIDLATTKDQKYTIILLHNQTSCQAIAISNQSSEDKNKSGWLSWFSKLRKARPRPKQFLLPLIGDGNYSVEHHNGYWILFVNDMDGKSSVYALETSLTSVDTELFSNIPTQQQLVPSLQLLIEEEENTIIQSFDVFQNFLLLYEKHNLRPQLRYLRLPSKWTTEILASLPLSPSMAHLPSSIGCLVPASNSDYYGAYAGFTFSSPLSPSLNYAFHFKSLRVISFDDPAAVAALHEYYGFNDMICRQLPINMTDGTRIPVTIFHQRTLDIDQDTPMLVEVYGSYGESLQSDFKSYTHPLLRRGWVIANVHVRGGGELGKSWHNAGRMLNKVNTFEDFMQSVQFLHSLNISSPKYTAALGGSAGAVPIAVAINRQPSLLGAAVLFRPFLEVLGSLMNKASHMRELNCQEWGDPLNSQEIFTFISSFNPGHNLTVESTKHTAILCMPALEDKRTPVEQVVPYLRRFRRLQSQLLPPQDASPSDAETSKQLTAIRPCLMYTNMSTGHSDGLNTTEEAIALAFLYVVLRLPFQQSSPPSTSTSSSE